MLFRSPSFFYSIALFCELVKPDPFFSLLTPFSPFLPFSLLSISSGMIKIDGRERVDLNNNLTQK